MACAVHVDLVQLRIAWEDKRTSFDRACRLLNRACPPTAALVILPEMFATGFTMAAERVAERAGGTTEEFLREIAVTHRVGVVAGMVRTTGRGRPVNQAIALDGRGRIIGCYSKIQLFSPSGEHRYYQAGSRVEVFRWGGLRMAMFICYDLRFPELFRAAAARGAEAFIVIANWPETRQAHWDTLLRARAIENQAYVIGVNRVGNDPHAAYAGGSCVVDPRGSVVVRGGRREGVVTAELDRGQVIAWRKEFPALRDAPPERSTGG
jgi:omega-amidase